MQQDCSGLCALSVSVIASILQSVWRSAGLCCRHESHDGKVARVWLRQLQRPELRGDSAGSRATCAGWQTGLIS